MRVMLSISVLNPTSQGWYASMTFSHTCICLSFVRYLQA